MTIFPASTPCEILHHTWSLGFWGALTLTQIPTPTSEPKSMAKPIFGSISGHGAHTQPGGTCPHAVFGLPGSGTGWFGVLMHTSVPHCTSMSMPFRIVLSTVGIKLMNHSLHKLEVPTVLKPKSLQMPLCCLWAACGAGMPQQRWVRLVSWGAGKPQHFWTKNGNGCKQMNIYIYIYIINSLEHNSLEHNSVELEHINSKSNTNTTKQHLHNNTSYANCWVWYCIEAFV